MNKLCFSLKHFLKEGFSSGSVDSHIPPPEPKLTGARPKIPSTTSSSSVNLMNNCTNNPTDAVDKRSLRFFNYVDPSGLSDMSYPSTAGDLPSSSSSASHDFHRSYSTYDLGFANSKSKPETRRRRFMHRKDDTGTDSSNFNKTVSPEISMALPDFVQDHIALEMFYSRGGGNGSSNISPLSFEYDQLPDFAINENEANSR